MTNYDFIEYLIKKILLGKIDKPKILDYGCGNGFLVDRLSKDHDVIGVDAFIKTDIHPKKIILYPEMWNKQVFGLKKGLIPFPDSTFDIVYSNQVFEHVESLDLVLQEISRVIKPGGTMISLFPHKGVWREGHTGIPFMHWFNNGSKSQYYYAYLLRSLGLGYHKEKLGSIRKWAKNRCQYLAEQTFYRTEPELRSIFEKTKFSFSSIEKEYLFFRLNLQNKSGAQIIPEWIIREMVRRLAGQIVMSRALK